MKKIILIILAFFLVILCSSFIKNEKLYSLTIEVNNLRNSIGVVQFALYNKEGSIPDEEFKQYYKIQRAKIVNGSSVITFNNLPEAKYAVNILHDENDDGKIKKGFLLPKEGIGFSNFHALKISNRPTFSKAAIKLNFNMRINITIIYF